MEKVFHFIIQFFINAINFLFKKRSVEKPQKINLKFNDSGKFKIVQFTDLHEHPIKNEATIKFMESTLDEEKPELVVLTGDCMDGNKYPLKEDVLKVIENISKPMEDRKIPWAVVLGNHDCELCKVNRNDQMEIYMSYDYNTSSNFSRAIGRAGDYKLLINDSKNTKPIFNIYMMDSGDYALGGYGYIKKEQIEWYVDTFNKLKEKYEKTIPSLMFFHIPLRQQNEAWQNADHIGDRNENECVQQLDTGLFSELIKSKDVKAVFVGHDHINDYFGKVNGIILGYGRSTGYNGYGKEGFNKGARIFIIDEKEPEKFDTYERLAEG